MKAVIQRVSHSKLKVDKSLFSEIGSGLMILLGITHDDNLEDLEWLAKKVAHLRIFDDEDGVMNKSVMDVNGEIQVVSQFTLFALTKKEIGHPTSMLLKVILLRKCIIILLKNFRNI